MFNGPDFIATSTDNYSSLDSEDDFRTGCRKVNHQQQIFSKPLSPGRSHYTNYLSFDSLVARHVRHDLSEGAQNVRTSIREGRVSIGLTVSRKTVKNLAVRRKNYKKKLPLSKS